MQEHVVGNRYFPDQSTPAVHKRTRPKWAKGVELKQEDLEALPPTPPRGAELDVHQPKRDAKWLRALAAQHTDAAIAGILDLAQHARDEKVRLAAWQALLDRGWGKSSREVVHTGEATVRHIADPGALHAKLVRAVETIDESHQLGPAVDAEAVSEPE